MRIGFLLFAFSQSSIAIAQTTDAVKHGSWLVTPRFNSLNMAPVSGNIINAHANVDAILLFTKNRFKWMVANAIDFEDRHSEMNYLLTNVRYNINLFQDFSVSPFFAYYSEHAYQLIDPVSDFNGGVLLLLQKNKLSVETFVLVVRLTHPRHQKDIINRLEIKYDLITLTASMFLFQNTGYFDKRTRLAVGFKITLAELLILNTIRTRTEVTGSFRIQENPETNNLNGVFLSLAFPIALNTRI